MGVLSMGAFGLSNEMCRELLPKKTVLAVYFIVKGILLSVQFEQDGAL